MWITCGWDVYKIALCGKKQVSLCKFDKKGFAALHDGYERFFKFRKRQKNKKIMQKSRLSAYVIRKRACFYVTCKNGHTVMITEEEKRYRKVGVTECGKDVQARSGVCLIRYFSTEVTQFAPSAAAVMIWRSCLVRTSPAANTPGIFVTPSSPALI